MDLENTLTKSMSQDTQARCIYTRYLPVNRFNTKIIPASFYLPIIIICTPDGAQTRSSVVKGQRLNPFGLWSISLLSLFGLSA